MQKWTRPFVTVVTGNHREPHTTTTTTTTTSTTCFLSSWVAHVRPTGFFRELTGHFKQRKLHKTTRARYKRERNLRTGPWFSFNLRLLLNGSGKRFFFCCCSFPCRRPRRQRRRRRRRLLRLNFSFCLCKTTIKQKGRHLVNHAFLAYTKTKRKT